MIPTKPSYVYACKVMKVLDGDTVRLMVDLGLHSFEMMDLRLDGVEAPELDSKDVKKRILASSCHGKLQELLFEEFSYILVETKKGPRSRKDVRSFSRYVGTLYSSGVNLNLLQQEWIDETTKAFFKTRPSEK